MQFVLGWCRYYGVKNSIIDISADIHAFLLQQCAETVNFTENLIVLNHCKHFFSALCSLKTKELSCRPKLKTYSVYIPIYDIHTLLWKHCIQEMRPWKDGINPWSIQRAPVHGHHKHPAVLLLHCLPVSSYCKWKITVHCTPNTVHCTPHTNHSYCSINCCFFWYFLYLFLSTKAIPTGIQYV